MISSFAEHFRMVGILNRQGSEGREMRVMTGLLHMHFSRLSAGLCNLYT